MELIEIISHNLEWWLHKREYQTIEKFAHENNFQKSSISRLIRKAHMPKADLIVSLAQALEITPDSLLLEPKKKPKDWGKTFFTGNRSIKK